MVAPKLPMAGVDRDHLSYRQRRLIELCVDEGRTLEEAGRMFNITRERARQIIKETGVELRAARAASRANGRTAPQGGGANVVTPSGLDHEMRAGVPLQDAREPVGARNFGGVPELMGTAEVAEALGVKTSNLQFIPDLPEPVQRLRATRIWRAQDIREFAVVYRARRNGRATARR